MTLPLFISKIKKNEESITILQVRQFLYYGIGIRELFQGSGYTIIDAKTKLTLDGVKEYSYPNLLRSDLKKETLSFCFVDLKVSL